MYGIIQIEIAIEIENSSRTNIFDPDFDGDFDFEKDFSGTTKT